MRSSKLFLGLLVGFGLLAAYWFLLLAPKREEVAKLEQEVATKQEEVTAAEGTLATYRQARDDYKATYARVTMLGKAVPADDDVRSLVVQLDAAAKSSKVNFRSIAVAGASGPSTAAQSGAAPAVTPPPGAISSGSAGFSTMPFTLAFSGSYARLSDLFTELERFVSVKNDEIAVSGRLMRVDSIALAPTGSVPNQLKATVTASTYLVPSTTGVAVAQATQAAGAATPTTATTTASAPSGGSTAPTTTATATGAIE